MTYKKIMYNQEMFIGVGNLYKVNLSQKMSQSWVRNELILSMAQGNYPQKI